MAAVCPTPRGYPVVMALLAYEDVQQWVADRCQRLSAVDMPLSEAMHCVLAEDVHSAERVPPFANTAMDGFAVRAADVESVPCDLVVVATLAAGAKPTVEVGPGEAIRIMTGAAIPAGADAIVPVENVDRAATTEQSVRILESANVGDAVRPAGEDVEVGQLVFRAGAVLSAGHLGVLSSIGATTVRAYPRVRLGVLSTGDELISAPTPLEVGQIRDSNRLTLLGLGRLTNCEVVDLGVARDTEQSIEAAILDGLARCDALVTSGGVSMGDFDYVKVVLDRLSAESEEPMRWMQIAIKPAKPLAFGLIGGKPVFGLPGNPVSSMVSFELFARAALRTMMGHEFESAKRPTVRALAGAGLDRRPDGKTHFVRVVATMEPNGRYVASSSGGQGSNLLRSMALANALAVLPDGDGAIAGQEVDVLLLG